MRVLSISLLLIFGVCIGAVISAYFNEDTGSMCLQMYDNPEDQSECVWLLNNRSM
jgi:hypothetical protein